MDVSEHRPNVWVIFTGDDVTDVVPHREDNDTLPDETAVEYMPVSPTTQGAVEDRVQCGPDCRREDNLRCSCDQCQDNCVCALGSDEARCPDTPPTRGAV
jgi:hypothetical protein